MPVPGTGLKMTGTGTPSHVMGVPGRACAWAGRANGTLMARPGQSLIDANIYPPQNGQVQILIPQMPIVVPPVDSKIPQSPIAIPRRTSSVQFRGHANLSASLGSYPLHYKLLIWQKV